MPFFIQFSLLLPAVGSFLMRLIPRWGMAWLFMALSLFGPIVQKISAFIGFSTIAVIGINYVSTQLLEYLVSSYGQLPSDVASIIGIMKLDVGLSLIVSAGVVRQLMNGLNKATDSRRTQVWKAPNNPVSSGSREF